MDERNARTNPNEILAKFLDSSEASAAAQGVDTTAEEAKLSLPRFLHGAESPALPAGTPRAIMTVGGKVDGEPASDVGAAHHRSGQNGV